MFIYICIYMYIIDVYIYRDFYKSLAGSAGRHGMVVTGKCVVWRPERVQVRQSRPDYVRQSRYI